MVSKYSTGIRVSENYSNGSMLIKHPASNMKRNLDILIQYSTIERKLFWHTLVTFPYD